MRRQFFAASLTLLFFVPLFALTAHAAVVGRFTQVVGQVDLLKQGKLPALAAKVQDGVEPGDVIRTKSKAKAQLTMVDDSIITLAPESRLAIAEYQLHTPVLSGARGGNAGIRKNLLALIGAK